MRPWLIQLGAAPVENREELGAMQFILGPEKFLDEIWRLRRAGNRTPKPRSRSWPASCFDEAQSGYVLAQDQKPKVIQMRGRAK